MGFMWGIISVLLAFVALVTIFDIVKHGFGIGRTAAWVLLVVVLPLVGSLFYWVFRGPTDEELQRAADASFEDAQGLARPSALRRRSAAPRARRRRRVSWAGPECTSALTTITSTPTVATAPPCRSARAACAPARRAARKP